MAASLRVSTPRSLAVTVGLALAGSALLALSAKIHVPSWPVPTTLQIFAVFALAACGGRALGVGAMLAYLIEGALGAPVFSGTPERGIGLAYMVGPTGGFLVGQLVAAWLIGTVADARPGKLAILGFSMIAGLVVVYSIGVVWLRNFVPESALFSAGVAPFIVGDCVKAAGVLAIVAATRRFTR